MFTRTFHCTDFEGKPYDVTYDFHLSKADILKINFNDLHGLDALLKKLIDTHNGKEIMALVDTIIMTAVGKETLDHKRFVQNDEIREEFRSSEAYSQLFEEMVLDASKSSEFLVNCLPASIRKEMAEKEAQEKAEKQEHSEGE